MFLLDKQRMKNILSLALLFLVGACFYIFGNGSQNPAQEARTPATIAHVVDGDTIIVNEGGKDIKIRLIGLDTPETVDPRRTVECFGKEASDKAKEILTGQAIRIETDSSQGLYDKYGRFLAYIFLSDGTNFSEMMIREGYGYEYTFDTPYKYQSAFRDAEKEARDGEKGLWAPGVCDVGNP